MSERQDYTTLLAPCARSHMDDEFGIPTSGGTARMTHWLGDKVEPFEQRWAEWWAANGDGTSRLQARWESIPGDTSIGFGFIV